MPRVALLLLALAAPLFAADPPKAGRKVAFLVGVGEYKHHAKENQLGAAPVNDVTAVAAVLKENGFTVVLLTDGQATRKAVLDTFRLALNGQTKPADKKNPLGNRDVLLVMLCGHGIQVEATIPDDPEDKERKNKRLQPFFQAHDTKPTETDTMVPFNQLVREAGENRVRTLFLVDACRENTDPNLRGGKTRDGNSRGKAVLPDGVSILYSCSEGELANQDKADDKAGHGLFTRTLLQILRGETGRKDEVSWADLVADVSKSFRKDAGLKAKIPTGRTQTPDAPQGGGATDVVQVTLTGVPDPKAKSPGIAAVMRVMHGTGAHGLQQRTTEAVGKGNWETAESATGFWTKTAAHLEGAAPPKGEKESWEKLAGAYVADVRALDKAVKAKDEKAATATLKAIGQSCKGCHENHKAAKTAHVGGEEVEFEIADGVKMTFCWIPPGECQLGSPKAERLAVMRVDGYKEEPAHIKAEGEEVRGKHTEKKGFWLAKYPVTQEQWTAVMGTTPFHFHAKGDGNDKVKGLDTNQFPAERVSWDDSRNFIAKVNKREGAAKAFGSAGQFRLPHEDEWEYAYRGGKGNGTAFYWGDELNGDKANCKGDFPFGKTTTGTYLKRPTVVGSYAKAAPHPWGLCDMSGNVYQWCDDWYDSDRKDRILRGGSWFDCSWGCRASRRHGLPPDSRFDLFGCRLCFSQGN